jgi:anion-transporting  ArsA/GET3 family ATPase
MVLDALLGRRLVVLTGKGGVGKSTVGAALALAAHARGKRVLLVEIDTPSEATRSLGATGVPQREVEALPGLSLLTLDPTATMEEYVRHVVKVDFLAARIFDSPVYHRFVSAAPGLKELVTLGKVMVLEERREGWGRRPRHDLIVLDAPATGHGLAFLKVPLAATRAVPVGPVGHNARRVLELLQDRRRTALCIVAIPEEMAVVEARQLHDLAVDELDIRPEALFLNACHERRFREEEEAEVLRLSAEGPGGLLAEGVSVAAALHAARRQIRRRKMTRFYQDRLRRTLPAPVVTLPHLFASPLDLAALRILAQRLEAA